MAAEDFGAPARDAGLGYVHYAVGVEESSLATRYPRDHRVLRDPTTVRREGGWMALSGRRTLLGRTLPHRRRAAAVQGRSDGAPAGEEKLLEGSEEGGSWKAVEGKQGRFHRQDSGRRACLTKCSHGSRNGGNNNISTWTYASVIHQ
ncbi:hypothetical protein PR202_gb26631 [Eleusine coracana subsp. coracana]|uniref:Uncharacterized protein n=1 Tax=Eleusine coracana subsp. coracana TaxID=191504 RepID=A0AAV5FRQ5_ELECO|nr:hypothetical protein PR202_gb26631 [Eleusine coracana subsp. coracana]